MPQTRKEQGTGKTRNKALGTHHEVFRPSVSEAIFETERTMAKRAAESKRRAIKVARVEAGLSPDAGREVKYGDPEWVEPPRYAKCGTRINVRGDVSVNVNGGNAYFGGVMHCGSVWACEHCSSIIKAKKAEEVKEATDRWSSLGGSFAFLTLTIPHGIEDSLEDLKTALLKGWAWATSGKRWRRIKAEYGIEHFIRSIEVRFSWATGWHIHMHILLFLGWEQSDGDIASMRAELFASWSDAVKRFLGRDVNERGLDVQGVVEGADVVAAYISKVDWNIADEMTRDGAKDGRSAVSISPFQLLDEKGDRPERLWDEYVKAMKGVSSIRWSKGLRRELGMSSEQSDAKIVAEATEDRDENPKVREILLIDATIYDEIVSKSPEIKARVLQKARANDLTGIAEAIGVKAVICARRVYRRGGGPIEDQMVLVPWDRIEAEVRKAG